MKEISFAKIDKVIKNAALPKTIMFQLDAGDEQIEVEVKTSLSLRERTDMAFEIADMIFPEVPMRCICPRLSSTHRCSPS